MFKPMVSVPRVLPRQERFSTTDDTDNTDKNTR
jgi:hypothetical protein